MDKIALSDIQSDIQKSLSAQDAAQFMRVYVPYNQTFGFIHVKHAAALMSDPDTVASGLIMARGNELVIAHDASKASEVTSALRHLAQTAQRLGIIELSGERSRITPEWSDEDWEEIDNITPVADVRFIRLMGFPIYTTQLVHFNPVSEKFKLAIRAEGKGIGTLDLFAGGKIKEHATPEDNMIEENEEETGTHVNLTHKHPDRLRKLGTVRLLQRHDDFIFQRHIVVFAGRPNGTPQITKEVAGYEDMTAQEIFDISRTKGHPTRFQGHVVPVIKYFIAHSWRNRPAMQFAEKHVDITTNATLDDLTKAIRERKHALG